MYYEYNFGKGNIKVGGPALNKFEYLDVKKNKQIKKLFKVNGYKKDFQIRS